MATEGRSSRECDSAKACSDIKQPHGHRDAFQPSIGLTNGSSRSSFTSARCAGSRTKQRSRNCLPSESLSSPSELGCGGLQRSQASGSHTGENDRGIRPEPTW